MTTIDIGEHEASLTNDEYRALNGITSTELRRFMRAPILMDHNPLQKSSDARTIGLMAHMVFSNDPRLSEIYQESFYTDGRLKEAKAEKKEALERGVTLLKPSTYLAAKHTGEAAQQLLADWVKNLGAANHEIIYEVPIVAECPASGLAIKSRPDALVQTESGVWIVDLKTCSDATARGFARQSRSGGYITQLAHYAEVQEAHAPDVPVLGCIIIAVETSEPHAGAPHNIDPTALTMERLTCAYTYAEIAQARESGVYANIRPGTLYGDSEAVRAKHPDELMRRAMHFVSCGMSQAKSAEMAGVKIHKLRYALKKNPLNI